MGPTFKLVTRFASFVFPLYRNATNVLFENVKPELELTLAVDKNFRLVITP